MEQINIGVKWDPGASCPVLIASDTRSFLIVRLGPTPAVGDVRSAGTTPEIGDAVALLELVRCRSAKLGDATDEAIHGHPLWDGGLVVGEVCATRDSPWITELRRINEVHRHYRDPRWQCGEYHFQPPRWDELNHFILPFRDRTFERVAERLVLRGIFPSIAQAYDAVYHEI